LQIDTVDLRDVLAHGLETVRPFLEARRDQLVRRVPDKPVWMRGDFARPTLPTISLCGVCGILSDRRSASVARRAASSSLYCSSSLPERLMREA